MRLLGASGISLFVGCRQNPPSEQPSSLLHGDGSPLSLPTTPVSLPKAMVAIGRTSTYEPQLLRQEMERMLQSIGGLNDLVTLGARVGIKPNLTGVPCRDETGKPLDTELFVTHPAVVNALGEALLDMGAGKLFIMDGIADETSFDKWGYTAMAKPLGAQLLNLCKPDPYRDFKSFPVGPRACVYEEFYLNPILNELDVFVSIGKMKCHANTGVTLSLKNLIGLAPISRYRRKEHHNYRSEFHESVTFDSRLSRVILDLNHARPIHLAIIDGIMTAEGGAGPWDGILTQVKPGVLIAGKDPVAADAVGTAVMGFDPNASAGTLPFVRSDNHLALARECDLGTNLLDEIEIAGPHIQDVVYKFKPAL
ncbi:MAG TPA: DUF362 domain-containing protein [Thermodesulfobacteriota bacterium]|nr:DUF362 domain-containing protein [Thermodesulfobacteriota bacterium]